MKHHNMKGPCPGRTARYGAFRNASQTKEGTQLKVSRYYTKSGQSPYDGIEFEARKSEIKNPDGSSVFKMENVMVPAHWSQVATDILAQKYFRKAGLNGEAPNTEHRIPNTEHPHSHTPTPPHSRTPTPRTDLP